MHYIKKIKTVFFIILFSLITAACTNMITDLSKKNQTPQTTNDSSDNQTLQNENQNDNSQTNTETQNQNENSSATNTSQNSSTVTMYIVSYYTEYGTAPSNIIVQGGSVITSEMLPELTAIGKQFDGWYINNTRINGNDYTVNSNITLTARWLTGKPTYKVMHYKETLSGSFVLSEEELKEGNEGSTTQANPKDYYGFYFSPITQQIITKSNNTVVEIYYSRKTYTLTLDFAGGVGQNGAAGPITISGKFESPINYPNPTRTDYIFYGWNIKNGALPYVITMNAQYTALWTDNGNSFEIGLQNTLNVPLTYCINNNSLVVTAEPGFNSYLWKIDTKLPDGITEITSQESPNILTITDFTSRENGAYIIQVTAIKNNIEYSGTVQIQKD